MKRLIDDPEIARELRAEMQRYANEQAHVDLKRVYTRLEAGLPLIAAQIARPHARLPGRTWSSLSSTTKLLIVAAIGGSSIAGISAFRAGEPAVVQPLPGSLSAAPTPGSDQPLPASHGGAAQPPSRGSMQPAAPEPAGRASKLPDAAVPQPVTPGAQPLAAGSAPASLTPEPSSRQATVPGAARGRGETSSGSRREIAQLARIKALLEQDPAAARRLIRASQREFPAGLLVEEREGLDVIALFALAQEERARRGAERFIARYPQSPLRPKLERLIADARE